MVNKVTDATQLRVGSFILIEGDAYIVKSMDISKTGKHGHSKVRFEANSLTGLKKKVVVVPGHERFEVPVINKRKAQVLSLIGNKISVMDSESFENFELELPEELEEEIKEGNTIEYWDIEGKKVVRRGL